MGEIRPRISYTPLQSGAGRFIIAPKRNSAKDVEIEALNTVAAFLNSRVGGTLILGIADDGEPLGIRKDGFRNKDAMGLYLRGCLVNGNKRESQSTNPFPLYVLTGVGLRLNLGTPKPR